MKKKKRIIAAVIAAAIIVFFAAGCGEKDSKETLYTCPMHPQIIQDGPGSCPICGMDLVKVEQEEDGHRDVYDDHSGRGEQPGELYEESETYNDVSGKASVHISPYKRQLINLILEEAMQRELSIKVSAAGTVAFDPELYNAQQDLIALRRSSDNGITQRLLEPAVMKLKSLGFDDDRIKEFGKMKSPDRSLIANEKDGDVWVYAGVYQRDLRYLEPGMEAKITVSDFPDAVFKGVVKSIDNVLDRETRAAKVRIKVENSENLLRQEMYVNVNIETAQGIYLSVSKEAVFDTGLRQIVFVDRGDGYLEPRDITPGMRTEKYVEVKSGIKEGERIVVNGNFLVDSESSLKGVLSNISGHDH